MELASARRTVTPTNDYRCALCASELLPGDLCRHCWKIDLDSLRFAELFWDEV